MVQEACFNVYRVENLAPKLLAEAETGIKNRLCKIYFARDDLRFDFSAKQNQGFPSHIWGFPARAPQVLGG
jgi:hypothetical protein